jgi:two-component system response regulator FixJ
MAGATVHIVDDDQAVRKSLKLLINSAGLRAEEYEGGRDFLERYEPRKPECLLLDLRMPDIDGLAVQRRVRERGIKIVTLFLSGHGDIPIAVRAIREGALDFVEKPFDKDHLLERVRVAIEIGERKEQARMEQQDARECLSVLTSRELQIVELLVEGRINKVIASDLDISTRTVESHRARIMKKLAVNSLSDIFKLVFAAQGTKEGSPGGADADQP